MAFVSLINLLNNNNEVVAYITKNNSASTFGFAKQIELLAKARDRATTNKDQDPTGWIREVAKLACLENTELLYKCPINNEKMYYNTLDHTSRSQSWYKRQQRFCTDVITVKLLDQTFDVFSIIEISEKDTLPESWYEGKPIGPYKDIKTLSTLSALKKEHPIFEDDQDYRAVYLFTEA